MSRGGLVSPGSLEDRVCPFCPLHCDDLRVSSDGNILANGCSIAEQALKDHSHSLTATIGGQAVSHDEAVLKAAQILSAAKAPLVSGLAADVEGLRGAIEAADKLSAVYDHAGSDGYFNNLNVIQRRGSLTTTPAEVRNRADVVILFGTEVWKKLPRLFERYLPAGPTLFDPAPKNRKVFLIGGPQVAPTVPGADVVVVQSDVTKTPELALALSALLAGRKLQAPSAAGVALSTLAEIAQVVSEAQYAVLAWDSSQLGGQGDLAVEAFYDVIMVINKNHRGAGLPLPSYGHVTGAYQVSLWQVGTALRTSIASGKPQYDPLLNSFARQTKDQRYDALLWVASLPGATVPKNPGVPLVVISSQPLPEGVVAEVFIPVAVPSLDHAGTFFRGDGVVSLYASPWHASSPLPSAAAILSKLVQHLPEREVPKCSFV